MSTTNLALCLTPSLFHLVPPSSFSSSSSSGQGIKKKNLYSKYMTQQKHAQDCLCYLIDNAPTLFSVGVVVVVWGWWWCWCWWCSGVVGVGGVVVVCCCWWSWCGVVFGNLVWCGAGDDVSGVGLLGVLVLFLGVVICGRGCLLTFVVGSGCCFFVLLFVCWRRWFRCMLVS